MNTPEFRRRTAGRFPVPAVGLTMALLTTASAFAQPPISDPVYPSGLDPAMLARLVDGHLVDARAAMERLVAVRGPRTPANTLRPFDDVNNDVKLAEDLAEELDFSEVPSQMLEEFILQPTVLRRISGHVETGTPIPDDLLKKMRGADAFSRPMQVAQMATMSTSSLELHDRPADKVDPDALARRAFATADVDLDPDMHVAAAFDHVGTTYYSATYYTFLWPQVIAKDLWSAFDPGNPLDPKIAQRYRDTILRPGKSRPASESVREFLGRPFDLARWRRWLEGE